MIDVAIKTIIENITGVNAYPVVIPEGENLAIAYRRAGRNRNPQSTLGESNIIDYSYQISIVSKDVSEVLELSEILIDGIELYAGVVDGTRIENITIYGDVDIFDTIQHNYEKSITIRVKVFK